jgi:hydroxyacylglutathione hydrolase
MIKATIIPVTSFEQNCTLIWNEDNLRGAVIDPGGDMDQILEIIQQRKVQVEIILITHAHLDHAGATAALAEKLGVPIEGPHPDDQFLIDQMEQQAHMFGFPPVKAFTPTRWLHDGDTVSFGGETMKVIHTPGHTPGHVVFVHEGAHLAIVGDVLFAGSIGRTDFPRGDYNALMHSIKDKLFPLGENYRFICGHGPMSTFGQEMRTNPFVGG